MTTRTAAFCVAIACIWSLTACGDDSDEMSGATDTHESADQRGAAGSAPPPGGITHEFATLRIHNSYGNGVVTGVFLSLSTESEWGDNQLDGTQLQPGHSFTVERIPCGDYYDLKLTGRGGSIIGTLYDVFFECGIENRVTLSP